ncbi:MYPU_1760 family metalloprotease [Mycoplasmopsis gallopavonis]|uniref:Uncharacterized protein n=1 Tax=Mycoplasmopsis gallopavonis TaxID=76629 RepID=A0A449AYX9_9BACT|nr:hypothetical protein [Mycoplasmopsis gallopavonis]RIV16687.1 hypothetical protein D1113_01430 [Mycoplasmopsis gallopavonis]VEU72656.1 Uncharacterised protein [Mycoplasmopsis gallopavonis]
MKHWKKIKKHLKTLFISLNLNLIFFPLLTSCIINQESNRKIQNFDQLTKLETKTYLEVNQISSWPLISNKEFLAKDEILDRVNYQNEDNLMLKVDEDLIPFWEYKDPYTQVVFRDYALNVKNNQATFLLGREGLMLLAREFKRKISFSSEVLNLSLVAINDAVQSNSNQNGFYSEQNHVINVFFSNPQKTLWKPDQILAILMSTIFHEYTHHLANSYISSQNWTQSSFNLVAQNRYFDHNFWNQFSQILRYNDSKTLKLKEFQNNFASQFSLKDLVDQNFQPASFELKFSSKKHFSPLINSTYTPEFLKYIYSIDELIAREYTKYAYEQYVNIHDELSNSQNKINFFGYKVNKNFNYYTHIQDWFRTIYFDQNFLNEKAWTSTKVQHLYPNDVFASNKALNFYNLFLQVIGYGKEINQIYSENKWHYLYDDHGQTKLKNKEQIYIEDDAFQKLRITGFVQNKEEYSGIVLLNKNNQIVTFSKLNYLNSFNFFGHKTYDQGATITNLKERQIQIENRIYPQKFYYSYYTDFLNLANLTQNDYYKLYFYKDKNNDQIPALNEILFEHTISIPERFISSLKGPLSQNKWNNYVIAKNQDGIPFLQNIKRKENN